MADPLDPVRVGLVGAGPWATNMTAPTLAAGPETELVGVWSRSSGSAARLAASFQVTAFESYQDLLERCDAVAFAISPAAQPELAIEAARAGKALLLEKPLALDVASAERLAQAVEAAGVGSMVVFTYRYAASTREFLRQAAVFKAAGGRGCFISPALTKGPFAGSTWRQEQGCLFDLGPHLFDLMEAALGPIQEASAAGDRNGWLSVTFRHGSGVTSQASLCGIADVKPRTQVELFGRQGSLLLDARADDRADMFSRIRREFAEVVRNGSRQGARHPLDVHRGLEIQRILAAVEAAL